MVIGIGVYWYTNQMNSNGENNNAMTDALDSARETKDAMENNGMIASIKDAMSSGVAMRCTYAVGEEGNSYESTVIVQGDKFRADAVVANTTTHALFDGTDQYVWTEGTKTGFKMSKACLDEISKMAPETEEKTPSMQDTRANFEAAKNVSCSPATGTDFSAPADITFTDQCAQMKDSMKMMEQYKAQMPAGSY